MNTLHDLLDALAPLLAELVVLLLSPLLAWALLRIQSAAGITVEAKHREALHSALMTGVRSALSGAKSPAVILDEAVAYARRSVPDAVAALQAPDNILRQIAEAKMAEALGQGRAVP